MGPFPISHSHLTPACLWSGVSNWSPSLSFFALEILVHLSKVNSKLSTAWISGIEHAYGRWDHPDHIHVPILPSHLPLLFESHLPICKMRITTQRCGRSEWVNIYKIAFTELATWFLPSIPLGWKHRQHCQSSGKKLKQQRHFKGILSWWDYYYHKQLQNVPTHSPHQRYILPLCLPAHLCFGGYSNDERLGTNSLS